MTIQKTLAVAMVLAAATSCIGPTVVAWRALDKASGDTTTINNNAGGAAQ